MIVSRFEANRKVGREDHTNILNYTKTHVTRDNYNRNGENKTYQKDKYTNKPYDMKELKCYKCGRTGHMKKDCRVKIAAIAERVEEETRAKYSSLYMHQLLSAKDGNKLMTISGSVNGKKAKIAIDSGCTTSIMATHTYEKYKDCFQHRFSEERVKTADNRINQVKGGVKNVEINIAGHVCTMDMLIFDHEDNDILLGLDYCEKMNLGIFPGQNMLSFPKEKVYMDNDSDPSMTYNEPERVMTLKAIGDGKEAWYDERELSSEVETAKKENIKLDPSIECKIEKILDKRIKQD